MYSLVNPGAFGRKTSKTCTPHKAEGGENVEKVKRSLGLQEFL